ncbi:MAG: hypothetical protein NKF70_05795 [Methanobacterium sp. ERen5]|nr:MAG: hypothetical protein NKF70_05795 [Methanobacterium sp. ERen5]
MLAVLMIFGLALVMNLGGVSAANTTNTTVQSHITVQSTVATSKNVTTTVKKLQIKRLQRMPTA